MSKPQNEILEIEGSIEDAKKEIIAKKSDIDSKVEIPEQKRRTIPACCVCTELPYDPQSLSCGHSLCIICCQTMLIKTPDFVKCPLCTKVTLSTAIIPNYALREILHSEWKDEYELREITNRDSSEKRKATLEINKLMKEKDIFIFRGKDRAPRVLFKILTALENNPDKSKVSKELEKLLEFHGKKFLYLDGSIRLGCVYSSGILYYICSPSYKLIILM